MTITTPVNPPVVGKRTHADVARPDSHAGGVDSHAGGVDSHAGGLDSVTRRTRAHARASRR
eukprot:4816574-Pyramimonas_sp.AAC.1